MDFQNVGQLVLTRAGNASAPPHELGGRSVGRPAQRPDHGLAITGPEGMDMKDPGRGVAFDVFPDLLAENVGAARTHGGCRRTLRVFLTGQRPVQDRERTLRFRIATSHHSHGMEAKGVGKHKRVTLHDTGQERREGGTV